MVDDTTFFALPKSVELLFNTESLLLKMGRSLIEGGAILGLELSKPTILSFDLIFFIFSDQSFPFSSFLNSVSYSNPRFSFRLIVS
jgi:hypothetical protein